MLIFPDLPDVEVEGIEAAEEITLTLRTVSRTAVCPSCGTASSRIQSRYTRTLRDLPSVGHPIRLLIHVRRFFCSESTCVQKIFVERLPELCHPHAQRTKRLQEALRQVGLAAGDQAGADQANELGISGSRDTILRLLRQLPPPAPSEPHMIGLDDWAWKRRQRYGTLICDLERNQPLDLLPDRTVETVEAWLKQHPSVRVVSRDGSTEYASAIRKGAPQAQQVSDRWHLLKNLAACVSVQMTKTLAQLRHAREPRPAQTQAIQQVQQARHAERMARYEQIMALQKQGMKSGEIAKALSMSQRTLQRWMATGTTPYSRRKSPRHRLIDPYKSYLLKRWQQGCQSGAQLARELRAKGYTGSDHGIYRYLETLKAVAPAPSGSKRASKRASAHLPTALLTLSPLQATWLFFRLEADRKPEEQEILRQVRQASPHLEATYQLVEAFLHMVRERTADQLDSWFKNVQDSHLQAFHLFVTGVQKDKEAVLAGLTLPWSTGPLEGQINRGIRSLNAVCMGELSSTFSSSVFSIRTKRVQRERRSVKNNKQIVSQNRG
jgi:transposase